MGISWAEGLGYVFQGAAEGSEKIREEKLAQRFELMKEDKQTINEIAKTRYATDLATFNEETKKVKSIESALANIKGANNGKGMDKYNAALQLIMADKVKFTDGNLVVSDNPIIPFIEGDGIGPDIWEATVRVFDSAISKSYGKSALIR